MANQDQVNTAKSPSSVKPESLISQVEGLATPRPWSVFNGTQVVSAEGRTIADCQTTRSLPGMDADAALIVRAVNSFDALKKACFAALVLCNTLPDEETEIAFDGFNDFSVRDMCKEALKLAEGK